MHPHPLLVLTERRTVLLTSSELYWLVIRPKLILTMTATFAEESLLDIIERRF